MSLPTSDSFCLIIPSYHKIMSAGYAPAVSQTTELATDVDFGTIMGINLLTSYVYNSRHETILTEIKF